MSVDLGMPATPPALLAERRTSRQLMVGNVAVVIWERIRYWIYRLRGRPDPGLIDYRKLIPLSFGIFLVLIVFGTMLILADIVNPVNIG